MFLTGPVARFAGNAKLGHLGLVAEHAALVPRLPQRLLARLGVVAKNTAFVPDAAFAPKIIRIGRQERAVGVNPAFFDNMIGDRQAPVASAVVPGHALLEPVRADQPFDLVFPQTRRQGYSLTGADLGCALSPGLIERLHVKRIAFTRHARGNTLINVGGIVEVALDEFRRGVARHGAMIGLPPTCVVSVMALEASLRSYRSAGRSRESGQSQRRPCQHEPPARNQ